MEKCISNLHWTDQKSGNPEKAGKMASLIFFFFFFFFFIGKQSHQGFPWSSSDIQLWWKLRNNDEPYLVDFGRGEGVHVLQLLVGVVVLVLLLVGGLWLQ